MGSVHKWAIYAPLHNESIGRKRINNCSKCVELKSVCGIALIETLEYSVVAFSSTS